MKNKKSGVKTNQIDDLLIFSKKLNLNVVGLMCIPPVNKEP